MDSFDDYKAFLKIEKSDWWSELIEIIYDQIEDNVTLAGLYKMNINSDIAIAVIGSCCKKYFDFDHAYSTLRSNKYMILVEEIGVYCIFDDVESYQKLREEINCTMFQIVNNYEMQKISFYVNDENCNEFNMDKFKMKCVEYFGKEVSTNFYNEYIITIEEEVDDFEEVNNVIDLFRVYLDNESLDIHVADLKVSMNGMQYLMYKVTDEGTLKYWLKEERMFVEENNEINIINNGMIGGATNNVDLSINNNSEPIYVSKTEMKKGVAIKWIKLYPPTHDQSTVDYFNEYKMAVVEKEQTSIQCFTKIVKDLEYKKRRSGNINIWQNKVQINKK